MKEKRRISSTGPIDFKSTKSSSSPFSKDSLTWSTWKIPTPRSLNSSSPIPPVKWFASYSSSTRWSQTFKMIWSTLAGIHRLSISRCLAHTLLRYLLYWQRHQRTRRMPYRRASPNMIQWRVCVTHSDSWTLANYSSKVRVCRSSGSPNGEWMSARVIPSRCPSRSGCKVSHHSVRTSRSR